MTASNGEHVGQEGTGQLGSAPGPAGSGEAGRSPGGLRGWIVLVVCGLAAVLGVTVFMAVRLSGAERRVRQVQTSITGVATAADVEQVKSAVGRLADEFGNLQKPILDEQSALVVQQRALRDRLAKLETSLAGLSAGLAPLSADLSKKLDALREAVRSIRGAADRLDPMAARLTSVNADTQLLRREVDKLHTRVAAVESLLEKTADAVDPQRRRRLLLQASQYAQAVDQLKLAALAEGVPSEQTLDQLEQAYRGAARHEPGFSSEQFEQFLVERIDAFGADSQKVRELFERQDVKTRLGLLSRLAEREGKSMPAAIVAAALADPDANVRAAALATRPDPNDGQMFALMMARLEDKGETRLNREKAAAILSQADTPAAWAALEKALRTASVRQMRKLRQGLAARLVAAARQDQERRDLSAARDKVLRALRADPWNAKADELRRSLGITRKEATAFSKSGSAGGP